MGNQKTLTHTWPHLIEINRMCPVDSSPFFFTFTQSMMIIRGSDKFFVVFAFRRYDLSIVCTLQWGQILHTLHSFYVCCLWTVSMSVCETKSVLLLLVYFRISKWLVLRIHDFFVFNIIFSFPLFFATRWLCVCDSNGCKYVVCTHHSMIIIFVVLIQHRGPLDPKKGDRKDNRTICTQ